MLTREWHEAQENWQAAFEYTRTGKLVCLMRTLFGGYYWSHVEYDGLFAWGGTRMPTDLRGELAWEIGNGMIRLLSGTIPEELLPLPRVSVPEPGVQVA